MNGVSCEELCNRIQNNIDVKSNMEKLYLQEKHLIEMLAKKHCHESDYEDLCQVGYLGLDKAAKTYDPAAGSAFYNYAAKRIEWSMLRYLKENGNAIRIPSYMYERVREYKQMISEYCSIHGDYPDAEYIMQKLNLSSEQIDDIERAINTLSKSMSLDQCIDSESDDLTLSDVIADPDNQIDVMLDDIERAELRDALIEIIDSLHGREPEILKKRYFEGKSSIKCSQELGVSSQYVIKVEHNGLDRIRKTKAEKLKPYVSDIVYANGLKDTGITSFRYRGFESSVERDVMLLEMLHNRNEG